MSSMTLTAREKCIIDFMVFIDLKKDGKMSEKQTGKITTKYLKKNYPQFSNEEIAEFLLQITLQFFETRSKSQNIHGVHKYDR